MIASYVFFKVRAMELIKYYIHDRQKFMKICANILLTSSYFFLLKDPKKTTNQNMI